MMSLGNLLSRRSKVVLLHYHLFKNAGTTIDFVLRQNFGEHLVYLHGDSFDSEVSQAELLDFLNSNPGVAAISSHHMRPPSPGSTTVRFVDIIILREPQDRLCSMYDFYRGSDQEGDPLCALAKKLKLGDFIRQLRDEYPHLVGSPQVNFIANQGKAIPTVEDLSRGLSWIRQVALLGTTELLSEALTSAEFRLRSELGKLDFSYMSQNVTHKHPRSPAHTRLREACGPDFYDEVCQALQFDTELHRQASVEVHRRFNEIPDRQERLEDFRARCRRHERNAEMIIAASNHPHDFLRFLG